MSTPIPRPVTEHTFLSFDGTPLFYRHWAPTQASRQAVLLFHRGHEHSGRWQDVVDKLNLPDQHVFAWDARGHGRSPGERGYAEDFGVLVRDVQCFVQHLQQQHQLQEQDLVVLAHSVGAVVAATWVHDYAPKIRALVLGSPALRVRLYVPFAIPGLRLLLKFKNKAFVNSYVKAKLLTHDPAKQAQYDADPLITRAIAVNILVGLYDAASRLIADAGAITVPTLMLTSGADWVVKQSAQRQFFAGLGSTHKRHITYPGFFHDTFNERDNHLPVSAARQFMLEAWAQPPSPPSLLEADQRGYTHAEFLRLQQSLPWWSLQRWQFALSRCAMRSLGRCSQGVRLGWATGFDSGATLDYVYENKPRGWLGIGRLFDANYLSSIGWRGIRQRKIHLEELILRCLNALDDAGLPLRVLDVATGQGRYVLDALSRYPKPVTALLRDFSHDNVAAGQAHAQARGMPQVRFEQGDAFDPASLARIEPQPTLAIVSGLYELFPDNAMVQRSLAGIYERLAPGGYLIYTGQPWHPQLAFIARVLVSHRGGQHWVMRRRTQQEMDQLVEAAGWVKRDQRIDVWGIFTVAVAQKPHTTEIRP